MSLGSLTDLLGISAPEPPIVENLPRSVSSFQNKYAFQGPYEPLAQVIPGLDERTRGALVRYDQERVVKGALPVSTDDTLAALSTILSGEPYTKPPSNPNPITDLPNAIFRDIRDIARSIPRMPAMLVQEAQDLPKFNEKYAEQLERTGNPLAALAASPGLRMLPGAYAVENIAGGTPGELLRRPVFTALDLAPAISKGGKAIKATEGYQKRAAAIKGTEAYRRLNTSNVVLQARKAFGQQARDTTYALNTNFAWVGDAADPRQKIPANLEIDDYNAFQELSIAKEARSLLDKYEIPMERRPVIKQALEYDEVDAINPSVTEQAFIADYKDVQQKWERYSLTRQDVADSIREVYDPVTGATNVFPAKQARRIEEGRTVARYYSDFASLRNAVAGEGRRIPATLGEILDTIEPYFGTDVVADVARRRQILDAATTTLAATGFKFESRVLKTAVAELLNSKAPEAARTTFDSLRADDSRPVSAITRETVLDELSPVKDVRVENARRLIQAKAYEPARRSLQGLLNSKSSPLSSADADFVSGTIDDLKTLKKAEKFLQTTKDRRLTDKRAAQAEAAAERRYRRTLPAKYQPLVDRTVKQEIVGALETGQIKRGKKVEELPELTPEVRDKLIQDVTERNFTNLGDAGIFAQDILRIQREVSQTWTEMQAAGINPTFVHRVSPEVAGLINYPTIKAQIRTPSSVKERAMDATPHYEDLNIAINQQGLEWLTRRATQNFVEEFVNPLSKTHDELYNQYVPFARQRHALRPDLDINAHVDQLMKREWVKFDPEGRFTFAQGRTTGKSKPDVYVPKVVGQTIEQFFNDNPGLVSQLSAPFMNGFRTSVLTLSTRWHVYNILGGAVMMMARTNPITVWEQLGQAREMLRTGEVPPQLRGELGKAKLTQVDLAKVGNGMKLGEFLNDAWAKVPGGETIRSGFNNITDKSWRFNQFVDDMYRTMSFLYGKKSELRRGLSEEQAIKAGVELSRKIMPDWNSMTPIERNVMRSAFPFYGFMSHVLRYVYKYPADHPVRASIVANFARAELADMEDATPSRFMEVFGFGGEDEEGNKRALAFGGFNPFSGASDLFTMAGLLSQVNPLLATALQQVGVVRGTADLNPDVRYDPDTGRLALQSPNPVANLFARTLPQVNFLAQLANPTSELNKMRASNPEVAEGLMRGALGIPRLVVPFNEQEEQMKAELARREGYNKSRAEALKTGIDAQAKRYPQLAAYLSQLRSLQQTNPDMFSAYAPGTAAEQLGIDQTSGVTAIAQAQKILLGELIR